MKLMILLMSHLSNKLMILSHLNMKLSEDTVMTEHYSRMMDTLSELVNNVINNSGKENVSKSTSNMNTKEAFKQNNQLIKETKKPLSTCTAKVDCHDVTENEIDIKVCCLLM